MKKFLILCFIFCCIISKAYSAENIITTLSINNEEETDIEILIDKNKIYLPCKFLLKYFQIPYTENHAKKTLSFSNTTLSQGKEVFFVKNCLTGTQNEFFIPAETFKNITGKNIWANSKQLTVYLVTKDLTKEKKLFDENPFLVKKIENVPKAYSDGIELPQKAKLISLDKVIFRENMYSDTYSQIYKETQSSFANFNNNLQLLLSGKLKNGEYNLDFGTNSYTNNMFSFSGISPKYKNKYKNYDYVLGKVDDWKFSTNTLSSDIIGVQFKNHVEKNEKDFRSIEGKVDKLSTVEVCLNNDYKREISTYDGYFNLKNIDYNKNVDKIILNEVKSDGTKTEFLKKNLKNIDEVPTPNKDFILGINGLQNRLWASNGYIYRTNTQKLLGGAKFYKRFSDKLSTDNFLIADTIFKCDTNSAWMKSILGNKRYLNYTTMQNQNALSGETFMGAVNYKNNEKFNSKLTYGGSFSKSTDGISKDGLGFLAQFDEIYKLNKDDELKFSLFAISPAFYLAGFSNGSGFMADRCGGSVNINKNFKKMSLSGGYSKYKSNFANYYEGGLMDFDEYNLNFRTNFKKLPMFNAHINSRRGGNGIGEILSTSYDFNLTKHVKCFDFDGGYRGNEYSNKYKADGYSSYKSDYSDIYSEVNFPLGKRFGYFTLGHNIVKISSDTTKNNYNSINFQYVTPPIKSFTFKTFFGLHYTGTNKGNDYGFGISKRLKSGSTISLNYRFSQIPFYMVDNMCIPGSIRHSITLDFSELYGIGSHGLQAVGVGNQDKGFIQITAFLDVNQNGKFDKGEPLIDEVPFKINNDSKPVLTEKNGKTRIKPEDKGIYNVKVFEDELPTLISCFENTKSSRYVKVEQGEKTKLKFGFVSTVGNIAGSVTIKDEFENQLKVEDLIVSVVDTLGREVNYTNVNEDGTFSFSGLNPGKYIVEVDKELQDTYKIKPDNKTQNYTVEIPPVYKDYVNIDNVNLTYVYSI